MTAIAGLTHRGRVYIGGDSAGVRGTELRVRSDPKVFVRDGRMVFGFTSSFRMGQLLRYRLRLPDHPKGTGDMEYLATAFVDEVRKVYKDGGFLKTYSGDGYSGSEAGGEFVFGYCGRLYLMQTDFSVGHYGDGLAAAGCGSDVVFGALYAARGSPTARIKAALEAAERFGSSVRAPFVIESV